MKYQYLTAAALVIAASAPAVAQDAATDMTPAATPAATSSFTGPRAEIFGGYVNSQARYRSGVGAPIASSNHRTSGGLAGGELGYDVALGDRFVAGPLGSFALTTSNSCQGNASLTQACLRPQMEWSAGARAGAKLLDDRALLYVKGAFVNTSIKTNLNSGGVVYDDHLWRHGYRAGAGIEYALNAHVYLKAEYDYTRTNRFDVAPEGFANTSLRYDRQQVVGGFGVRF